MVSWVMFSDQAEARLAAPKKTTVSSNAHLRPILSASGPKTKAPTMRPNRPAPNRGASCPAVTCQSAFSAGAMKPMAPVSKPSIATMRKHKTSVRI